MPLISPAGAIAKRQRPQKTETALIDRRDKLDCLHAGHEDVASAWRDKVGLTLGVDEFVVSIDIAGSVCTLTNSLMFGLRTDT